jgi:hypothetical protein
MAAVKITGSAEELREALATFSSVADEYESDGVDSAELWPRMAAAEHQIDEFKTRVRQRIREAAG